MTYISIRQMSSDTVDQSSLSADKFGPNPAVFSVTMSPCGGNVPLVNAQLPSNASLQGLPQTIQRGLCDSSYVCRARSFYIELPSSVAIPLWR